MSSAASSSSSSSQLLRPFDDKSAATVESTIDGYLRFYNRGPKRKAVKAVTDDVLKEDAERVEERRKNAVAIAVAYYNVTTDFYDYGWGDGLHYSVLQPGDSRASATAKHEYYLALKLGLKPGETVLDVGCGIGGPARRIASLSEANVTGLNINDYQLAKARFLTEKAKLDHLCSYVKGDFNHMPYGEGYFDKAYAIEATVYSPSLYSVYSEVFRVLKPGGLFALYEVIRTDKYNPRDPYHRQITADLMEGSGLADIPSEQEVLAAARQAGFEILENRDRALDSNIPWYKSPRAGRRIWGIKIIPWRWITRITLFLMETLRLAPRGSLKVFQMMCKGKEAMIASGIEGLGSPMYLLVLRKPSN